MNLKNHVHVQPYVIVVKKMPILKILFVSDVIPVFMLFVDLVWTKTLNFVILVKKNNNNKNFFSVYGVLFISDMDNDDIRSIHFLTAPEPQPKVDLKFNADVKSSIYCPCLILTHKKKIIFWQCDKDCQNMKIKFDITFRT